MIKPLIRVLEGERNVIPPIWLMRQAGRYLPEYREIRARAGSFMELCLSPECAAQVTLQPVRRFGFDAAILFSDILVIPHALGQKVSFEDGDGPRLTPLGEPQALRHLRRETDQAVLAPVYETIARVRGDLPPAVALLGFCGAPWTVATYMIAGGGAAEQIPARDFAYRHPEAFKDLIDLLSATSADHLVRQLQAGADAVQIFDTWAGVLPAEEFRKWCIEPCAQIVAAVRESVPGAKIIGFPRGAGTKLAQYVAAVPVDAIGLDWMIEPRFARERIQKQRPVQGNLDPLALLAGGAALDRAIDGVMEAFADGPFIFNLGHGVLPATPLAHVERLVARVRGVAGRG